MKTMVLIGGMGSGKSSVLKTLEHCGAQVLDLDAVGHKVLEQTAVQEELAAAFGSEVVRNGAVDRAQLALKAFENPEATVRLNAITLPRIQDAYAAYKDQLADVGVPAVAVEFSAFRNRDDALLDPDDIVIAVTAPLEERVARAVAHGWNEEDVRNRIACQITDEARLSCADVVFENTGSLAELEERVESWYRELML